MHPEPELLLATPRFRVVRHIERLADGALHARETVVHPGAVAILPILDDGRVCLIRNYRVAVDEELIELPAGTIDPGEDPLATARRELAEETGYRAERFERLHEFWISPGILNERMHLFLATGLTAGPASLQEGERIRTLLVAWDEALAMVADRRIRDAKTLFGLLYYERVRREMSDDER